MMGSFDYGLMMLGLFCWMGELVLVLVAVGCGIRSLILLARRPEETAPGRRLAPVAIGLGVVVELLTIAIFVPWRFSRSAVLHWVPFPAFLVGGCALALWTTSGSRHWSSTGRLMILSAVATIATGGVQELQRWDRRRDLLDLADLNEEESRRFLETSEAERRCFDHQKRGETCERCKVRRVFEAEADYFLKFAQLRAAAAESYRRAAAHAEESSIPLSIE